MKSIIGEKYFSLDNSYTTCLTNDGKSKRMLAACPANDFELIPLTILTNPFKLRITTRNDKNKLNFILVIDDQENVFSVMFYENGLVTEQKTVRDFEVNTQHSKEFQIRYY